MLLLFLFHSSRDFSGNANYQKVSPHPPIQKTALHCKSGTMISVPKTTEISHQPLPSVLSYLCSQTEDLVPSSLWYLEQEVTVWINHWTQMKTEHEKMNYVLILFKAMNEEPRLFMTACRVTPPRGLAGWQRAYCEQALDAWPSYLEGVSNWEDNFRAFISVSFPLEFSSTN